MTPQEFKRMADTLDRLVEAIRDLRAALAGLPADMPLAKPPRRRKRGNVVNFPGSRR